MLLYFAASRTVRLEWPAKRVRVGGYNVVQRSALVRVIVNLGKRAVKVHVNLVIHPCIVVFMNNVLWVHAVKTQVDDNSSVQMIKPARAHVIASQV